MIVETCEYRSIYKNGNKIGVQCIRDGVERRITCELVCKECKAGNYPIEVSDTTVMDEVFDDCEGGILDRVGDVIDGVVDTAVEVLPGVVGELVRESNKADEPVKDAFDVMADIFTACGEALLRDDNTQEEPGKEDAPAQTDEE
jgi:hypothetical protein